MYHTHFLKPKGEKKDEQETNPPTWPGRTPPIFRSNTEPPAQPLQASTTPDWPISQLTSETHRSFGRAAPASSRLTFHFPPLKRTRPP